MDGLQIQWLLDPSHEMGSAYACFVERFLDILDAIVIGPRIVGVDQGRSVPRVVIPALVDHFLNSRMPFDKLILRDDSSAHDRGDGRS